jgi:ribosomal protein S18 acetylase RimI-like enzyme
LLECRLLSPGWESALLTFLGDIEAAGETHFFKPHPFTEGEVAALAHYEGEDLYYILTEGPSVLGYGMLRGWDEGYDVPSLGIAIHPSCRGAGLGRALMHFLQAAAARKGARRVRLRVSHDNHRAIDLYVSLGYMFDKEEAGLRVGILDLKET